MIRALLVAAIASPVAAAPGGVRAQTSERLRYEVELVVRPELGYADGSAVITLPEGADGRDLLLEVGRVPTQPSLAVALELVSVRDPGGGALAVELDDQGGLAHIAASVHRGRRLVVEYRLPLSEISRGYQGHYLYLDTGPGSRWYPFVRTGAAPDTARRGAGQGGAAGRDAASGPDVEAGVELPAGFGLFSCRPATSGPADADGRIRHAFSVTGRESCTLAIGDGFRLETRTVGSTTLALFHDPADERAIGGTLEPAATALEWFANRYGFFPEPYVGILPASRGSIGATAYPGTIWLHRGDLSPGYLESIMAHELGHFYWGLFVRDPSGERLGWLTLANGIWVDQLFRAERAGRTLPEQFRAHPWFNRFEEYFRGRLLNHDQRLGLAAEAWQALPYSYNTTVRHGKAAVGVYLLAERLGSDRFLAVQRDLLDRFGGRRLTVEAFGAALEGAGLDGASAWLRDWTRGDASIEYAVESVELIEAAVPTDDSAEFRYRIEVRRLGTMTYPLTVAVRDRNGGEVRTRLAPDSASVDVVLDAEHDAVVLDPDGVVPMLSADHEGMRRLVLSLQLEHGSLDERLGLARRSLATREGSGDLRLRAAAVLAAAGHARWTEAVELMGTDPLPCDVRRLCEATLAWATGLIELGRAAEAFDALDAVAPYVAGLGLEDGWRELRDRTP